RCLRRRRGSDGLVVALLFTRSFRVLVLVLVLILVVSSEILFLPALGWGEFGWGLGQRGRFGLDRQRRQRDLVEQLVVVGLDPLDLAPVLQADHAHAVQIERFDIDEHAVLLGAEVKMWPRRATG